MRNVRALCGLAVLTAAVGCGGGSDQSGKGAQAPTTETPPSETQAQTPAPSETEMGPSATQPGQTTPGQPGTEQTAPGQTAPGQQQMMQGPSSNELLQGTLICMLGPMIMDSAAGSMGHGSMGHGSMSPSGAGPSSSGQGSSTQGSMGQGSSGQGSMGQGSSGQGSMGQGSTGQSPSGQGSMGSGSAASSPADQCIMVAQAANVMPTSLALGESSAVDSVRRALDSRLSVEGASQDSSNNSLAFFDKGVAAAKEARVSDAALHGSSQAVGGGPTSSGSGTSSSPSETGSSSHSHDKKSSTGITGQRADDIRAHRALGDLYQFGRNMGATETGTEAQALAWIIAVDRFEEVATLPANQRALAAEPLFAVILNVPPPTGGRTASTWNEYLSAAARSVGSTTGTSGRAVGGGPSGTAEKQNLKDVARTAEERLQVLGQQLPPSSPLRGEVDRKVAHLRALETQATQPSTTQPSQPRGGSQKKPPAQPSQQPKQPTQPK